MHRLNELEIEALGGSCTLQKFCAKLATVFKVRPDEVAILTLRHSMLQFAYPPELRTTGMIPLISSAQAAKTATSKKAEIFNDFVKVRHSSIFEQVKIGNADPQTIQKLMSAPVFTTRGDVYGVMQICRKGENLEAAGADFVADDLKLMQDAAKLLGRVSGRLLDRDLNPMRTA